MSEFENECKASDGDCEKMENFSPNYISPGSEKEARWNQEKKYDIVEVCE